MSKPNPHTQTRSSRRCAAALTFALAFASSVVLSPDMARAADSGPPPSDWIGQYDPPTTAAQQAALDRKFSKVNKEKAALAREWAAVKTGRGDAAGFQSDIAAFDARFLPRDSSRSSLSAAPSGTVSPAYGSYSSNYLAGYHEPQEKSYYCGPAAAMMTLEDDGVFYYPGSGGSPYGPLYVTQDRLAAYDYLRTDYSGSTPWDSGRMPVTLNDWRGGSWYGEVAAPSTSTLATDATFDVDNGAALVGDVLENYSGHTAYHLPGHPTDHVIGHWVNVYGYTQNGDELQIADPAASPAVSWGHNVQPRYSFPTYQLSYLLWAHGTVW